MSAPTVTTTCAGCDTQIEQPQGCGRPRKWCSETCRKRTLYGGTCIDCGAPTAYSARPGGPAERCAYHGRLQAAVMRTVWTREKIITAIQDWVREYGEVPAGPDWNPTQARHMHDEARARRFEDANRRWPRMTTVVRVFGTWNAGIKAAGFEPRAAGGGRGNQKHRRRSVAS